jgi:predicted nucleotidyltransferase
VKYVRSMLHHSIKALLPDIICLLKKHKIERAFLFGSVLTEKFNPNSDVDFLVSLLNDLEPVEAGEHLWNLTYELEALLQRKVDLLTERSLKNPYFIREIEKNKLPIYGVLL